MTKRAAPLLIGAVAVLVVVVLGAAVGGPWQLEERNLGFGPPGSTVEEWPGFEPPPVEGTPELVPADLSVLGLIVAGLVAAVLVVAAWQGWRWLRDHVLFVRLRRRAGEAAPDPQAEPRLPVLQRGVSAAQRYLDEVADAGDAVIAAWLALEEAAEASGVTRVPAQTPTEFTVAVLERTDADAHATRELLALYHRARFSDRPMRRGDVARASQCLARLAQRWSASQIAQSTQAVQERS